MLDLAGKRFGRLMVMGYSSYTKDYFDFWDCLCDCGKSKVVRADALYTGRTKSCGCLRREVSRKLVLFIDPR